MRVARSGAAFARLPRDRGICADNAAGRRQNVGQLCPDGPISSGLLPYVRRIIVRAHGSRTFQVDCFWDWRINKW